ncbi:MAG: Ig-like domain-containing protein, partial [Spirochaetia bacterium]|nr:Ig-like domain-containing protein [Spirochaetia bacterium]
VQDDKSSIAKLEYVIPKEGVLDSSQEWKAMGTSASWDITFASGAPDSSDSLIYYAVAENSGAKVYQVADSGTENIYKVPVWFRVFDSAGNEQIVKDQYVLVDSEGGKPKAWINSPEEGATTSGVVTIYGGASDNVSVSKVCVQLDANNNGEFDENDATYIKGSWDTLNDELKSTIVGSDSNWYIPASGTNSWKLNVDTARIKETNGSKSLRIRVKAIDNEGLSRQWSDPVTVNIDSETPVIKNLKIVQYGKDVTPTESTPTVTEREYVSGMYISNISVQNNGKWYLTGDVSDNQTVSSITFEMITSSTQNNIRLEDESEIIPDKPSYTLRVPLKTDESGVISYAIKAKDNNTGEATVSITINIDSTRPSLYNTGNTETLNPGTNLRLKSMSKMLGTEAENSTVVNNNSYFTFGDVVSEAGSGLLYTAFYFERNGTSGKRVYNPMFNSENKTVINSESFENEKVYINGDGLAALCVEDSSRTSEDSITLSSANANIRKGGLIKIAGGYSLITEVSGTTVKFSPTASTSFTQAELILAQVVDHKITESVDSLDGKTVVNDDGDGMIETINQIGSSYNWTASVDSNNIPDGPITVHVVAIDNAGNTTHGSIATKVENNRPRIAKVLLGTDLNDNGKYDWDASSAPVTTGDSNQDTKDGNAFGEFSYFTALNSNSRKAQSEVTLNSDAFKVINGLCIIPEFVGGNNGLGYILENPTDLLNAGYKTGSVTDMTSKDAITNKVNNKGSYQIDSEISDFGGIELTSLTSGNISITFWDKTEETTQGTDSQWALLKIPVNPMSSESEKPVPFINRFYWNNSTDNSVYIDGGIKGHIELEGDLTDAIKTSLGNEPKVSGKIKIEG